MLCMGRTDSYDTLCPPIENGGSIKTDFPDGGHGGHLRFLIQTTLAIFHIQVNPMLPTKSICLWVQKKKRKMDFQDGGDSGHLGFWI